MTAPIVDAYLSAKESQRRAIRPDASVWVSASAGSGKTRVLTDRVLSLLLDGNEPHKILCLTFTKAAAAEMANRLAERLAARLEGRDVVDSIRNPAEVAVLRRFERFRLIGVTAPVDVRYKRSRSRARAGDPSTLDEFRAKEGLENTTDPAAQRLDATFELADAVIDNATDLGRLRARVRDLLIEWSAMDPASS